jgi:predicted NBD/HSP70 family sugar kinase
MRAGFRIGVDLGGTKITVAALDDAGRIAAPLWPRMTAE